MVRRDWRAEKFISVSLPSELPPKGIELNGVLMSAARERWRLTVAASTNPPGVISTPLNRIVVGPFSPAPCPAAAATDTLGSAALAATALLASRFATEVFRAV